MSTTLADPASVQDADPATPIGTGSVRGGVVVATTRRQIIETLLGVGLFGYVWAVVLNFVLNWFHTGSPGVVLGVQVYRFPVLFLVDSALIWLAILFLVAVSGRFWLPLGIATASVVLVGVIDRAKMRLRLEPVYPSDVDFLRSPDFLLTMVGPWRLGIGALALLVIVAAFIRVGRRVSRSFRPIRRRGHSHGWWLVLGARLLVVVLCISVCSTLVGFNREGNVARGVIDSAGARWAFWSQNVNYRINGVISGALYNLPSEAMAKPAGYSRAAIDEIVGKYQAIAARTNSARTRSIDDVNVIVVLSEAFSDPTKVRGAGDLGADAIPFTRDVMSRTTSGSMLSQLLGGGTANVEFEALTGQSLGLFAPQVTTPYQQFVGRQVSYPSAVSYFADHGHDAIAIHPYMPGMYKRQAVYATFGFDDFVYDATMHDTAKLEHGKFISDRAAFAEVTRALEDRENPTFVNLVTMQNHYPWVDQYAEPWSITTPGLEADANKELSSYLTGLSYTDRALQEWLATLSAFDEKTAVVFYGDHLPALWGLDKGVLTQNPGTTLRETPFFIWTNFATQTVPTARLTDPTHFLPMLHEQIGAPIPPYYALLDEVQRRIPAIGGGFFYDPDGRALLDADLDPEARAVLADYRLVQYDLSIGERFGADAMFATSP